MSFLNRSELSSIGFQSVGENVLISDKASFHNAKNIAIGSNVRIDDFCVLSAGEGGIHIGNYIHIGCFSSLIGAGQIILKDYCNISSKVSVYSSNDDYSGEFMTNPMVPKKLTNIQHGNVIIGKHAIIGSGSVILPNINIGDIVAIGALSLINKDCDEGYIYAGTPAKKLKKRRSDLLKLESQL